MLYYVLNLWSDDLKEYLEEIIRDYLNIFNIQHKEELVLEIAKDTLSSYRIYDLCDNLIIYAFYNAISSIVLKEYGVALEYHINGISDCGLYAKNNENNYIHFSNVEDFYLFYFYDFIIDNKSKNIIKDMQIKLGISDYAIEDIIMDVLDEESLVADHKMIIEKVIQSIKNEYEE